MIDYQKELMDAIRLGGGYPHRYRGVCYNRANFNALHK